MCDVGGEGENDSLYLTVMITGWQEVKVRKTERQSVKGTKGLISEEGRSSTRQ